MTKSNLRNYRIRCEQPVDYKQIDDLLIAAFHGHEEVNIVTGIRAGSDYLEDLTLVAVQDGKLIGFIMLSYVLLKHDAMEHRVLSLGPLAVSPEFQKQGIGGALIKEATRAADERGDALIVLLGHAGYYPRFGFDRASTKGIYPPVAWPDEDYMIYPLKEYKPEYRGKICYSPAWGVTAN
jgi:putative acetyltransferase